MDQGEQHCYKIIVLGEIDQARKAWFAQMGFDAAHLHSDTQSFTLLTGQVIDQSHLRGILNKLWDLNFELVEVSGVENKGAMGEKYEN